MISWDICVDGGFGRWGDELEEVKNWIPMLIEQRCPLRLTNDPN